MAEAHRAHEHDVKLPGPPDVPRRIRLGGTQLAGLALLVLLPSLSAAGLLDPAQDQRTVTAGPLALTVQYPRRMRHSTNQWVTVQVQNRSGEPSTAVTVKIDPSYLKSFDPVIFVPAPARRLRDRPGQPAAGAVAPNRPAGSERRVRAPTWTDRRHDFRAAGGDRLDPDIGAAVTAPSTTRTRR